LTVVVALGMHAEQLDRQHPESRAFDTSRLQGLSRIAGRLHPAYLLPAIEPCASSGAGAISLPEWQQYLTTAARSVHAIDPQIKIAISASTFGPQDSALYAWAAGPGSPVDVVGFSMCPGFNGAETLEAEYHRADRWMQTLHEPLKEQWVFWAGGYPAAHGERSQELAVRGVLAWATSRSAIKGVIVGDGGDYGSITGLRAASGRLRPAALTVLGVVRRLRDTVSNRSR
jgi:hypothetical protein